MRDFLWRYFQNSGDIEAYLLLREHERLVELTIEPSNDADVHEPQVSPS